MSVRNLWLPLYPTLLDYNCGSSRTERTAIQISLHMAWVQVTFIPPIRAYLYLRGAQYS